MHTVHTQYTVGLNQSSIENQKYIKKKFKIAVSIGSG